MNNAIKMKAIRRTLERMVVFMFLSSPFQSVNKKPHNLTNEAKESEGIIIIDHCHTST
jgi:hypothetical protein